MEAFGQEGHARRIAVHAVDADGRIPGGVAEERHILVRVREQAARKSYT